jgi:hypothetical protein
MRSAIHSGTQFQQFSASWPETENARKLYIVRTINVKKIEYTKVNFRVMSPSLQFHAPAILMLFLWEIIEYLLLLLLSFLKIGHLVQRFKSDVP